MPAEPTAVRRAAEAIRRRWPDVEDAGSDEDNLARVLDMERRRRADDWQEFYWADAARAANAFLGDGLWRERRFGGLLEFLLFQTARGAHFIYLRAMVRKYIETFDPKSGLTRELARALKTCWPEAGLPIDALVYRFGIFDIDSAPHLRIAEHMKMVPDPFHDLRKQGLDAPHGTGLMEMVHRRFVSMLAPHIAGGNSAAAEKLLDWLDPGDGGTPLQGRAAGVAIDALLLPWAENDPGGELKNIIETRLIDLYGDLRVREAGVWNACSEDSRRVILKWLAGATVEMFFDIVTEADSSHMWADRKKLWIDLFEEGRITQAWFALSDPGADIARRREREQQAVRLEFARNESRSAQDRMKCLLIMNVDDHWVVEGSHNFPTWVFPSGKLSVLKPYEERYVCERIRNIAGPEQPERIVHSPNWGDKVLSALQQ